jgi:MoaA/NifB/PqqE/SkfB family radical SAM enzyme
MYCPAELHDKHSSHHSLETLKQTWQQVVDKSRHLNLQYKISFTGGEVTTNKNFLPLVEWIKTQDYSTQFFVTSNGSASMNYYRRLAQAVNGISLSTHSEFMDEKKFFSIARELNKIMVRPEKSLHVNIMDEHWNQDRIVLYKKFCQDHNISHIVNPINYQHQTRVQIWKQGKANIEHV